MNNKVEIKEEDPLSDDVASQNEREFFYKNVPTNRNSDAVLLGNDCEVTIKTEFKSEISGTTGFVKQNKFGNVTCSNNWEIDVKREAEEWTFVTDFGSQNETEFLTEDPVMKVKKCNDHKIEIKEEPWLLETEFSSVCDDIKDEDFPPVKSSRLCTDAASSDNPPSPSLDVSGRQTDLCNEKDHLQCESHKSDFTEIQTGEEHVLSKQSGKCSDGGKIYTEPFRLKQKNLIHEGKKAHQCKICDKSFSQLSHLKTHNLIHEGKKPHQCKICDKSFTQLSHLKTHNLIHEGKKQHQCKICDKSFTQLTHLKMHNLIHEGKKAHQCKTCDKTFTRLSYLKLHNLTHEDKKPHQCQACDKSFARLSYLKMHYRIHEGKKPYQCKTCYKSFTQLSHLKKHNLVHKNKKPH